MKDSGKDLVVVLTALFNELDLAEFSLDDRDFDNLNPFATRKLNDIATGVHHLKSLTSELLADLEQRVYSIEVESVVSQTIKVLAKNEEDANEMAGSEAERRLRLTFGKEHDYDVYSTCAYLGDESQDDDEADVEYPYDD